MAVLTHFLAKCIFYVYHKAAKKIGQFFFQLYSLKGLFFSVGVPDFPVRQNCGAAGVIN